MEPVGKLTPPARRRKSDTKFDTNADEFKRQRRTKIEYGDTQGKRANGHGIRDKQTSDTPGRGW